MLMNLLWRLNMQVSNVFQQWRRHQPVSYVTKKVIAGKFLRLDLGEFMGRSGAVPYPDPSQRAFKRQFAHLWGISEDMLTLGSGSDELIEIIPRIFLNPGDNVLVVIPTFFRFADASLRVGAVVQQIATTVKSKFALTDQTVSDIIHRAKVNDARIIWLCSPNNPTGVPVTENHIATICRKTKALVVLDSVFFSIGQQIINQAKLVKRFPNLIILRSLSKLDGGAGLRIGVAIANPKIIAHIEAWRLPFNIPTSLLQSGCVVLQAIRKKQKLSDVIAKERKRMSEAIAKLPSFEIGAPSETTIILLRHKTKDLFRLLCKHHILAADMRRTPGLEGMGFVRITIQSQLENTRLLTILQNIQKSMEGGENHEKL